MISADEEFCILPNAHRIHILSFESPFQLWMTIWRDNIFNYRCERLILDFSTKFRNILNKIKRLFVKKDAPNKMKVSKKIKRIHSARLFVRYGKTITVASPVTKITKPYRQKVKTDMSALQIKARLNRYLTDRRLYESIHKYPSAGQNSAFLGCTRFVIEFCGNAILYIPLILSQSHTSGIENCCWKDMLYHESILWREKKQTNLFYSFQSNLSPSNYFKKY